MHRSSNPPRRHCTGYPMNAADTAFKTAQLQLDITAV